MGLNLGSRLGPYEIVAPLGAGGMGEVYRARDTKLNREVAIKILPEAFALDRERLARFEREAQALAALHHPHIATIFGLEDAHGTPAIVMELVTGVTLAERLTKGPLPVDEAIQIARQVADGLEAAHEKGIVHRDLKPANIKLTPDGTVKILDFGLAKAAAPDALGDASNSPTFTAAAPTQLGVIIGTAAYMAPEQARGKAIDKRVDIWAFGCVLYEMLAGRPTFQGETVSELLAAVMRDTPPLDSLPPSIGSGLRRLIARCLQKDPRDRLRDIGDARWYLDEDAAPPNRADASQRRSWRDRFALPLAVCAAVAAGAALWGWLRPIPQPPALRTVSVPTPELSRVAHPVLSHTGDRIAFVGDGQLWIRSLAERTARPIPGTEGAVFPFWSPDGRYVGYFVGARVYTVAVGGGTPALLTRLDRACNRSFAVCSGAWTDNRQILLSGPNGAVAVSERGGAPVPYLALRAREHFHRIWALPGGRGALVAVDPDDGIVHVDLWDGRERRTLIADGDFPAYSPSGHVIVSRGEFGGGSLWAPPFRCRG